MTVIGMTLEGAKELLMSKGYEVVVKDNTSDRMKEHDATLVTNATFEDNVAYLTVSTFKLNI